jgi:hypothetical protein
MTYAHMMTLGSCCIEMHATSPRRGRCSRRRGLESRDTKEVGGVRLMAQQVDGEVDGM